MNHDVMRRGQSAALAASSALARVGQELKTTLPRRVEEKIEEICAERLFTDSAFVFESVIRANLDYWKSYGLIKALTRKLGIGDHPYR